MVYTHTHTYTRNTNTLTVQFNDVYGMYEQKLWHSTQENIEARLNAYSVISVTYDSSHRFVSKLNLT